MGQNVCVIVILTISIRELLVITRARNVSGRATGLLAMDVEMRTRRSKKFLPNFAQNIPA